MSDSTWTPRTARERVKSAVGMGRRAWFDSEHSGADVVECITDELCKTFPYLLASPVPAPPTRLREHRGVTFRDGKWRSLDRATANVFRALANMITDPTDADHAALLDLRERPTEPAPDAVLEAIRATVKQVHGGCDYITAIETLAATVCAIVRAEVEAPPLTVAEHVAALVKAGATELANVESIDTAAIHERFARSRRVVILPPEAP